MSSLSPLTLTLLSCDNILFLYHTPYGHSEGLSVLYHIQVILCGTADLWYRFGIFKWNYEHFLFKYFQIFIDFMCTENLFSLQEVHWKVPECHQVNILHLHLWNGNKKHVLIKLVISKKKDLVHNVDNGQLFLLFYKTCHDFGRNNWIYVLIIMQ